MVVKVFYAVAKVLLRCSVWGLTGLYEISWVFLVFFLMMCLAVDKVFWIAVAITLSRALLECCYGRAKVF